MKHGLLKILLGLFVGLLLASCGEGTAPADKVIFLPDPQTGEKGTDGASIPYGEEGAGAECPTGNYGCGCFPNFTCNQRADGTWLVCVDGACREPTCAQGSLGCGCYPGGVCDVGLFCDTSRGAPRCEYPNCSVGDLNCGCHPDRTCNNDEDGKALVCDGIICVKPLCVPGERDCYCRNDYSCEDGLICGINGRCSPRDCEPGTLNCSCKLDGSCEGENLYCKENGLCEVVPCPTGKEGCACYPNDTCDGGLYCENGYCQKRDCERGTLGCGCLADGSCVGDNLVCAPNGTCQPPPCPEGTLLCPCYANGSCLSGLVCKSGVCNEDAGCVAGTLDCRCFADGSCASEALYCAADSTCRPKECPAGSMGCACFQNGSCNQGLECYSGVCRKFECEVGTLGCFCNKDGTCNGENLYCALDGKCAPLDCPAGMAGCPCFANQTCLYPLSCEAGICRSEASTPKTPPNNPKCYSPCGYDKLEDSGKLLKCSPEGLLEGCLGGTICVKGNCVNPPGGSRFRRDGQETPKPCKKDKDCGATEGCADGICVALPKCESDSECPDFKTCIQSVCFSNCEFDSDCPEGEACNRHVCRKTCDLNKAGECAKEEYCQSSGGENGVCMPMGKIEGAREEIEGAFSISQDFMHFTNVKTHGEILLTNEGTKAAEFIFRKVEHTYYDDLGFHSVNQTPLTWLKMGDWGHVIQQQEARFLVEGNGGTKRLIMMGAEGSDYSRWNGLVEVGNDTLGYKRIRLSYVQVPEGQWTGKTFYFSSFGTENLENWLAVKDAPVNDAEYRKELEKVGNAFIQKWGIFRKGWISYDEMNAAIGATLDRSWDWPSTKDICPRQRGACFLYDNPAGYVEFTSDKYVFPVPSGVVELPMTMNLQTDKEAGEGRYFNGKVVSESTLHYPGDSFVTLRYRVNPQGEPGFPDGCSANAFGACLTYIQDFNFTVDLGGRFVSNTNLTSPKPWYRYPAIPQDYPSNDSTILPEPKRWDKVKVPWLPEEFTEAREKIGNLYYMHEGRDIRTPFGPDKPQDNMRNSLFNPIPNAKPLRRVVTLIDGALINQDDMVIIFKEEFDLRLGDTDTKGFVSYGLMRLRRNPTTLEEEDYEGVQSSNYEPVPKNIMQPFCKDYLLAKIIPSCEGAWKLSPCWKNSANSVPWAKGVISGQKAGDPPDEITPDDDEKVHYYCEDTGLIDGGKEDYAEPGHTAKKVNCPIGSKITFFTVNSSKQNCSTKDIVTDPCQTTIVNDRATCWDRIQQWQENDTCDIRMDPMWRCEDENKVYCENNRLDLRDEKTFYKESETQPVFPPLRTAIDEAYRYKTRFVNRSGSNLGFAPTVCLPNSDQIPYCYDPKQIEEAKDRVDCAAQLFDRYYDYMKSHSDESRKAQNDLRDFLLFSFSYDKDNNKDGFERLYAEHLVMMGDESFTKAFASRFDLAGSNLRSFEGSKFEENGIDISGGAGYEMHNLYKATQYYQMVLDRFFLLGPTIYKSVSYLSEENSPPGGPDGKRNFITQETVIAYFDRVAKASSQKSRATSEIAKRYQNFNRPDLAKRVIERGYSATYIEAIVMSRMMLKIVEVADPKTKDQILAAIEETQRMYRAALYDMTNLYNNISDEINYFGFSPDYIPFPALDERDNNAFEKVLGAAKQKLNVAAAKEEIALNMNRDFETDSASFQAELLAIKHNYEGQLGDICGTFKGSDNKIYPAIPKYSHLHEKGKYFTELCGLVGNGEIHLENGNLEMTLLDYNIAKENFNNLIAEIEIERKRVVDYCNQLRTNADLWYKKQETLMNYESSLATFKGMAEASERGMTAIWQYAMLSKCFVIAGMAAGSDCPSALANSMMLKAANIVLGINLVAAKLKISSIESDIRKHKAKTAKWEMERPCDYAEIDSAAKVDTLLLDLDRRALEVQKAYYNTLQVMARIGKLRNDAKRLSDEMDDAEDMAVNIEAARNDPNVRIYKNDAIITADRTFHLALQAAYKATKVFEYYTSQSYAGLEKLFLIRMVSYGQYSLESYLWELEDAFAEFQERYGNPDVRVAIYSLRDDILEIPRIGDDYKLLTEDERTLLFRERLKDPKLRNGSGHLSVPFNTTLRRLSPLTRNHKIKYIEAELIGGDVGDSLGRVYLKQAGTGTVRGVDGTQRYYGFPERTAVINTFFNGKRWQVFSEDEVFKNKRLRDRPFVNTRWEFVFNQNDETVNKDINLNSLSDMRIYIYYTDFTEM